MRVFLGREGLKLSAECAYRVWRATGLQVRRKRPRKRMATKRPHRTPPEAPNHLWAIDFVHDHCANGQKLKCTTVVDEWTRKCLENDVAGSIRARRVVDVLTRLVSAHGAPRFVRCDDWPKLVSKALPTWVTEEKIDTAFIDPGKPRQNGTDERFNGTLRNECLSFEWFRRRAEAVPTVKSGQAHYDEVRPHASVDVSDDFRNQVFGIEYEQARGNFPVIAGPRKAGHASGRT